MDGKIVLAGVAEANSPVQSVVSATTTNRETNTEVAFDWNLGRNEENLDGGFGAYETGKIAGVVFQDKNVDGFYSDKDINDRLTGDKPVAGETLQVAQWFFVPNGDTLPYEVDLGKEVELADGSKVTKTSDTATALKAAGFEYDDATSNDGTWFKSKSFSYRTNVADLPQVSVTDAEGNTTTKTADLDTRISVDDAGWFEGAVTNADGVYLFEELTSYVNLDAWVRWRLPTSPTCSPTSRIASM